MNSCPSHDSALARAVAAFCTAGHQAPGPEVREAFPSLPVWRDLRATGTQLWLDTGDVEAARKLWTREFAALTTNNTLLNKEVQKGLYDDLVPKAAAEIRKHQPDIDDGLLVQEIAFVLNAAHGLMLVRTFDADVSVELHTNLARDTEASYQYGKRFAAISPDRFIVKVPLTAEGLFAARKLRNDGIRVNFTLGFSARENLLIGSVARPNYVNVFMGRCNSFVADRGLGDGKNVGEKATLASQRALRELRAETGIEVHQIGASMRSADQAFDLAGLDVYTMPTAVAQGYLDRQPDSADVRDRTADDPPVTLHGGRSIEEERIDTMWAISDEFRQAVAALRSQDLDAMNGGQLRGFLAERGAGDLFADFDDADRERITADGKIPRYEPWAERVKTGELSWDGMLTESALASFTADQGALDDRIRQHL